MGVYGEWLKQLVEREQVDNNWYGDDTDVDSVWVDKCKQAIMMMMVLDEYVWCDVCLFISCVYLFHKIIIK